MHTLQDMDIQYCSLEMSLPSTSYEWIPLNKQMFHASLEKNWALAATCCELLHLSDVEHLEKLTF